MLYGYYFHFVVENLNYNTTNNVNNYLKCYFLVGIILATTATASLISKCVFLYRRVFKKQRDHDQQIAKTAKIFAQKIHNPEPPAPTLHVFDILEKEKAWLCMRGCASYDVPSRNNLLGWLCFRIKMIRKNSEMVEIEKIIRPKGFKDRSISPAGFVPPFYGHGFILKVQESDISECYVKDSSNGISSIRKFIGTNQFTGYGKRQYTEYNGKKVMRLHLNSRENPLFESFDAFKKARETLIGRVKIKAWTLRNYGGDEFITTLKKDKIIGIFYAKTNATDTDDRLASNKNKAIELQKKYRTITGIQLPIYLNHYDTFELASE